MTASRDFIDFLISNLIGQFMFIDFWWIDGSRNYGVHTIWDFIQCSNIRSYSSVLVFYVVGCCGGVSVMWDLFWGSWKVIRMGWDLFWGSTVNFR